MHPSLKKHGQKVVAALSSQPKLPLERNPTWIADVPYLGGVYALWKADKVPIYVGESSNLRDRLDEMTRLGRHNALWKLTDNDTRKVRNVSILNRPELAEILVSYFVIPVGRKEAEDYLISLWRNTLINKHDKRFQRRDDWNDFAHLQTTFCPSTESADPCASPVL